MNALNRPATRSLVIAIIYAVLLILSALPVEASPPPPTVPPQNDIVLFLPEIDNGKDWMTPQEFADAFFALGYKQDDLGFTWCILHDSSDPPARMRFSECSYEFTPDDNTDVNRIVFYYDPPNDSIQHYFETP